MSKPHTIAKGCENDRISEGIVTPCLDPRCVRCYGSEAANCTELVCEICDSRDEMGRPRVSRTCLLCGVMPFFTGMPYSMGSLLPPPWTGSNDARVNVEVCEMDYWVLVRFVWELLGNDFYAPHWWTPLGEQEFKRRYDMVRDRFLKRYGREL